MANRTLKMNLGIKAISFQHVMLLNADRLFCQQTHKADHHSYHHVFPEWQVWITFRQHTSITGLPSNASFLSKPRYSLLFRETHPSSVQILETEKCRAYFYTKNTCLLELLLYACSYHQNAHFLREAVISLLLWELRMELPSLQFTLLRSQSATWWYRGKLLRKGTAHVQCLLRHYGHLQAARLLATSSLCHNST
jgi:hypothetical protein